MEVQIDVNLQTETMSIAFGILEVSYNFSMLRHLGGDWLPKTMNGWRHALETGADVLAADIAEIHKIDETNFEINYNIISA